VLQKSPKSFMIHRSTGAMFTAALVILLLIAGSLSVSLAQDQQDSQSTQQKPGQQQAPPAAGGPQGDIGPIAIPKKTDTPPPPPPPEPKNPEGMPDYSLSVNVPLVSVDALVLTKDGQFIPGIPKGNFRIYEDGVQQQIVNFGQTQAPITAVLLVEFSNTYYELMYKALQASYAFADSLQKGDWVAVIEYDMRPTILQDFTQDKNKIYGALNMLRIPGFSETNLFDALNDTLDRLDRIEGRKVLVVVGSGLDTFSRITYDKILKKVKATQNVTIFTVSTSQILQMYLDMNPYANMASMDYLQADNQMHTFAELTGGRFYKPRFDAEYPEIFRDIAQSVRNEYTMTYHPTNRKLDGTYRKLKVELVDPATGKPVVVKDQKGKVVKYQIIARQGYTAKNKVD
jgi:VWFA-related protein